jgi:uncharacterized membrane protein YccF (DUF307 family)
MNEPPATDSTGGNSPGDGDTSVEARSQSPSIVVRAVYFLLVGWWASGIWLSVAWVLIVTIVGTPIGIKMINWVPKIVSLKERRIATERARTGDGSVTVTESTNDQHSLLVRAVYFLFVGWWASGVWMSIAWVASVTIVGLPLAIWMYSRLPFVVSLYRY